MLNEYNILTTNLQIQNSDDSKSPDMLVNKRNKIVWIIHSLIKAGANVNIRTKNKNQSVIEVAEELNDSEIYKIIKLRNVIVCTMFQQLL